MRTLPRPMRSLVTLVAIVAAFVALYGRTHESLGLPELSEVPTWVRDQAAPVEAAPRGAPVNVARAREQLAALHVRPAGSMSGYSREAFRHWSDPDHNGCDAREDTLRRDGSKLAPARGCETASGVWHDPYGGTDFHAPGDLDIDHIVPLANAWRSGASGWSGARREKIANDPRNLLAVSARLNRQKGDKGPEAWKPPLRSYQRAYAARWIAVKSAYGLSVTADEKQALTRMLG